MLERTRITGEQRTRPFLVYRQGGRVVGEGGGSMIDLDELAAELNEHAKFRAELVFSPSRGFDVLKMGSFVVEPSGQWTFQGTRFTEPMLAHLDIIRRHVAPVAPATVPDEVVS